MKFGCVRERDCVQARTHTNITRHPFHTHTILCPFDIHTKRDHYILHITCSTYIGWLYKHFHVFICRFRTRIFLHYVSKQCVNLRTYSIHTYTFMYYSFSIKKNLADKASAWLNQVTWKWGQNKFCVNHEYKYNIMCAYVRVFIYMYCIHVSIHTNRYKCSRLFE